MHPFAGDRQSIVEKRRVGNLTKGYASGGAVTAPGTALPVGKKAFAQRDAQAVEGGSAKERMDRPGRKSGGRVKRAAGGVADTGNRGVADLVSDREAAQQARENAATRTSKAVLRARGGRAPKSPTTVNVIVAPKGGDDKGMMPPPGLAGPMPRPMPPGSPPMPAGAPMAGPPGMPPGGPIRSMGGRTYATGGAVKSGPTWDSSRKAGTPVQNTPSGKSDQMDVGRGKVVTYATGGAVDAPAGKKGMGPKFDGGAGGGTARKQKERRAEKRYAKA